MLSGADIAKENNRQTMSANDVLTALRDLEFDEFIAPVEAALGAFRETEKARSIEAAAKKAAKEIRNGENKTGEEAAEGAVEEEPVAAEEPMTAEEPVAAEEPMAAEEPAAPAEEPAAVEEPTQAEAQEAAAEEPTQAEAAAAEE